MPQILLLEADRLIAKNLSKVLKRVGHRVDWQVDPQAAIASADSKTPDLVILDLVLAGRGGVEFLHEFRSYSEWQMVPVILFCNVAREELEDSFTGLDELGITAYHHKPVTSLDEIRNSVDVALAAKPVQ